MRVDGKGHYDIVRFLCESHKNDSTYKPINIHAYNEYVFRSACENGYNIVVNYLLKITKRGKYKPFENYLIVFKKIDKFLL